MHILYLGEDSPNSTAKHRANALSRLGNVVTHINPKNACTTSLSSAWKNFFHYHTGYRFLQGQVEKWLKEKVTAIKKADLIWVNSGELLGVSCMNILKQFNCPIVLYCNDDPTGNRDGNRFGSLLKAIPYYDLCAVVRDVNVEEFYNKGAKKVLRVMMSYDEEIHKPFKSADDIKDNFKSDVAFIGTWMKHEKRDEFLIELIKENIPVSIYGDHWQKSKYFSELQPYIKGKAIYNRNYVAGIQGAKICLGFLSKGNRDLYTRRSLEVPYIGSLFCGERTSEHEAMFEENVEAVFWSNPVECAKICRSLLGNEQERERIRIAGMKKVRQMSAGNEDMCRQVLTAAVKM